MENNDFLKVLDHLAWCDRCCFREDFISYYVEYLVMKCDWHPRNARYAAIITFEKIIKNGIVHAYQDMISLNDEKEALAHAYNIRR